MKYQEQFDKTKDGLRICNTCVKAETNPYRRIVKGVIIEGCIDPIHDSHLVGNSLAWVKRDSVKAWRVARANRFESVSA